MVFYQIESELCFLILRNLIIWTVPYNSITKIKFLNNYWEITKKVKTWSRRIDLVYQNASERIQERIRTNQTELDRIRTNKYESEPIITNPGTNQTETERIRPN